jgi:phosphatidate cytidylyltransferase
LLKQRILTALILAPIAIACIFALPPTGFSIFIGVVLGIGAWEWANFAGLKGAYKFIYAVVLMALMFLCIFLPPLPILILGTLWWCVAFGLMSTYPSTAHYWSSETDSASIVISLIGLLNLLPAFVALMTLKQSVDSSFLILLLFFLIWGADVGAYFSGRTFGKHKLAPKVSPGKSWEGFWGGLVFAVAIAVFMVSGLGKPALHSLDGIIFILSCAFIVMISVLGDLVESMFKRNRGIKDSSHLLPGHGGILDRVDSLLSAGPFFAILIIVLDWK